MPSSTFFPMDPYDDARVIISTEHHEIHEGHGFVFHAEHLTPTSGVANYIHIKPGALKHDHILLDFAALGGNCRIQIYESPTLATAGSAITVYDLNRKTANTATTVVKQDPTVTTVGTTLISNRLILGASGVQSRINTAFREGLERVWKPATDYLVAITPLAASMAWTCDAYIEEVTM